MAIYRVQEGEMAKEILLCEGQCNPSLKGQQGKPFFFLSVCVF